MLSTLPSSIAAGQLLKRGVDFRVLAVSGWTLVLIGNGLAIIWYVSSPTVLWAITQLVCGIGQVSLKGHLSENVLC